jgi:hypothetical protein
MSAGVPLSNVRFCKSNPRFLVNSHITLGVSVPRVSDTSMKPVYDFYLLADNVE